MRIASQLKSLAVLGALGASLLVGCQSEETVREDTKVRTKSDGTVIKEQDKVIRQSDGTTVHKETTKVDKPD